jgi:hypothetical protein
MGIKYAHKYTHSIKNLNLNQLYFIATEKIKQCKTNDIECFPTPTIDVDVSWIIRGHCKGSIEDRIVHLLNISNAFTEVGFLVHLVCDGVFRHHSKRATISRLTEAQKKKIDLVINKSQLMLLMENRQDTDSIVEKNEIIETQTAIQSKIRSLENALQRSSFQMGDDFFINLLNSINFYNNNKITACQALFQADTVMASRMVSKNTHVLLTSDSDQAALLGPDCLCIKDFKIKEEKKKIKIDNIEIFSLIQNYWNKRLSY